MKRFRKAGLFLCVFITIMLTACGAGPLNNPYPAADTGRNILYTAFSERPKHLDPARSYSSNEVIFIGQIYEPPLQYHYLRRPYELSPLAAMEVPRAEYFDKHGQRLPSTAAASDIAYSVYEIHIRPGMRYQPHPAFARGAAGRFLYHQLSPRQLDHIDSLDDFRERGTREVTANDFVYQIKRLAHPRLHSPIFGLMSEYIVGLKEYAGMLASLNDEHAGQPLYLDLDKYPLEGAEVIDRYAYRIKLHGKYPQFVYWLAMPFFAPVPPEVDRFYNQAGLEEKNITLDWFPVGSGPYMLTVNNPNRRMVLDRNPNFHGENYPRDGQATDRKRHLLDDAGRPLPFVDRVVFSLEKESIPYWTKFLQGYYDSSGISSDSFDQAIRITGEGEASLTDAMKDKGIRLLTGIGTSTFYFGFNMLDPVVGGYSERAALLRRAISMVVDYEEYISIFLNGRGIAAQGPIPPGIFGYHGGKQGINPYVYGWSDGHPQRKSIAAARRLLARAGYPHGRDAETGEPLVLYFDVTATGPGDKARLDWMRKQFQKLEIQLVVRNTDYNRFQDKMQNGSAQLFQWGWNADYPDPENFLFLLYGPNGKVAHHGENAANYDNAEFNRLFEEMKNMDNGPERQRIIDQMIDIARRDAPWIWGLHPKQFGLYHQWYKNAKPNLMANNTMKYIRIDPVLRAEKRKAWNKPVVWPLAVLLIVLAAATLPAVLVFVKRQRQPGLIREHGIDAESAHLKGEGKG